MMTENNKKNNPWGYKGTIVTDRAAGELRRGLPVLIYDIEAACVVIACELLTKQALANMHTMAKNTANNAELGVLISDKRANTLKIPTKGRRAVLISLEPSWSVGTIRAIADPTLDLSYPLKGPFQQTNKPDTPLEQAALKLLKTAALLPAGVVVTGNKDVLLNQIKHQEILSINVSDIENYNDEKLDEMEEVARTTVPLEGANDTSIVSFRPRSGGIENLAIIIGNPDTAKPVLTRLHSECFTGDLLGSLKC
ncbi:MAG: hypothetical protein KAR62_04405, partial [Sphingomonadales bacterium]|nr:hypothetical protein [Sphingomonadales bacterium]